MSAYRDDFLTIVEVDDGVGVVKGLCGMKCVLEGGSVCGESAAAATGITEKLIGHLFTALMFASMSVTLPSALTISILLVVASATTMSPSFGA